VIRSYILTVPCLVTRPNSPMLGVSQRHWGVMNGERQRHRDISERYGKSGGHTARNENTMKLEARHSFFVQYSALLMDRDMYTGSEQVPNIQALSETGIHSRGASSHKYIAAPTHAGSSNFCPWRTLSDKRGQKLWQRFGSAGGRTL
jgi:hypothetical protein